MCQVIWPRLYSQAAANTRLVGLEVAGLVEVDAALIKPYKVLSYQWLCHLVIWFSIVSILRIKAKWPRIFYCVDLKKTQSIILTFNIRTDRRTDIRLAVAFIVCYIHILSTDYTDCLGSETWPGQGPHHRSQSGGSHCRVCWREAPRWGDWGASLLSQIYETFQVLAGSQVWIPQSLCSRYINLNSVWSKYLGFGFRECQHQCGWTQGTRGVLFIELF